MSRITGQRAIEDVEVFEAAAACHLNDREADSQAAVSFAEGSTMGVPSASPNNSAKTRSRGTLPSRRLRNQALLGDVLNRGVECKLASIGQLVRALFQFARFPTPCFRKEDHSLVI